MANYQNLKTAISAAIKTNGNQEITGQVLQDVLNSIVSVIGANYTFAGVATPATNPGTPDQNVVYVALQAGTYTNFNGIVLPNGISLLMWNGTWTSETVMCGDGGVFDISVYKSSGGTLATFADLSAALDGGNNIPASARKGGMSVKFVQSSDNKYVQFRLMATSFSTTPSDWQGVDEYPVANSNNLVKSGGVFKNLSTFFTSDAKTNRFIKELNIFNLNLSQNTRYYICFFFYPVSSGNVMVRIGSSTDGTNITTILSNTVSAYEFDFAGRGFDIGAFSLRMVLNLDYLKSLNLQSIMYNDWAEIDTQIASDIRFSPYLSELRFNNGLTINDTTDESSATISLKNNGTEFSSATLSSVSDDKAGLAPAKSQWDEEPKNNSGKIVKSGGVFKNLATRFTSNAQINRFLKEFYIYDLNLASNTKYYLNFYFYPASSGNVMVLIGSKTGDNEIVTILQQTVSAYDFDFAARPLQTSAFTLRLVLNLDYLKSLNLSSIMFNTWGEIDTQIASDIKVNPYIADVIAQVNVNATIKASIDSVYDDLGRYVNISSDVVIPVTGNNQIKTTPVFTPNSEQVQIIVDIENPSNNTHTSTPAVLLSSGSTISSPFEELWRTSQPLSPGDKVHHVITFNPAYYAQYKNPAWTEFSVWLVNVGSDWDGTGSVQYLKWQLQVYNRYSQFEGVTPNELFESINDALAGIEGTTEDISQNNTIAITSPNNTRYRMIVGNDGVMGNLPFYPSKMHVLGNSLTLGIKNSFGMAASDSDHDYYHYLVEFFSSVNPSFSSQRTIATSYEGATSEASARSAITSLVNSLAGDEDLVILQIGDNVNTPDKVNAFIATCQELTENIKIKCSNARVVWVSTWYSYDGMRKYNAIRQACFNTGSDFVSLKGLFNVENQSKVGNVITLDEVSTTTMGNVISAIDDGAGNMTVVFEADNDEYSVTIPVSSYSLSGSNLTYTSIKFIVANSGVGSHPGDIGFVKIANKFLYTCGYTYNDTYFVLT